MFSKSKNGPCPTCKVTGLVMMVVGYLVLLLSLVGVVMAHIGTEDVPVVFGTMSGSLSLLVFVASLFFVKKMGSCCPCQCELPKKK